MPKGTFTRDEINQILYDDGGKLFIVVSENIESQGRWDTHYEVVFQVLSTGKFYELNYSRGSTEQQDNGPQFDDEDGRGNILCHEVMPVETVITKYVRIA